MTTPADRLASAALATLLILQTVMLLSLFTQTFPHPPEAVAPFAIAPFLAASLSLGVSALMIGPEDSHIGRLTATLAALLALVSFGPQKYFNAQIGAIWPAVCMGQIAVLILLTTIWRAPSVKD